MKLSTAIKVIFFTFLICSVTFAQEKKEVKTKIDFSGYARLRMTQEVNYNSWYGNFSDKKDNFIDARSYLTVKAIHGPVSGVFSLDIAGDDFNDGVEWGNPVYTPGVDTGPGFQSLWNVQVRHLWVQYKWRFITQVGRIPAGLGHFIVAHVNRDAIRFIFPIKKHKLILVAIKGANDRVTVPDSIQVGKDKVGLPAAREGSGDLNAYVGLFAYNTPGFLKSKGQIYAAKQQNTRKDPLLPQYPQKLFIGLTNDGKIGPIDYGFEGIYLGGKTAKTPAASVRDYKAYMVYLNMKYHASQKAMPKAAFGMGTGDDKTTDDKVEDFQALFLDEGGHVYTNIFADDIHGFRFTNPGSVANGSGFANVTWFQFGLELLPLMDNKLKLDAHYTLLTATEARTKGSGVLGTDTGETTSDIGSEFNLNIHYKLAKKLSLWMRSGYFMPGEIFGDQENVTKVELFTEFTF